MRGRPQRAGGVSLGAEAEESRAGRPYHPSRLPPMRPFAATTRAFDAFEHACEAPRTRRATGTLLVVLFLGALVTVELRRRGLLPAGLAEHVSTSHFAAISLVFTALLLVEVVELVLSLARSVAASVGAQFELFSLILLREAFKELGHLPEPVVWSEAEESVMHALADAGGALLVFVGVIVYTHLHGTGGSRRASRSRAGSWRPRRRSPWRS